MSNEPARERPPSEAEIRAAFDAVGDLTIGLEEEVLIVERSSRAPAPRADELVDREGLPRLGRDGCGVKLELPAAQLELMTPPAATVAEAVGGLAAGRSMLAAAAPDDLLLAGAGSAPIGAETTPLHDSGRYAAVQEAYGFAARRQLVCALQVHVAVRGADRALAVHNALRSYLPEIAALAANAPFHAGEDSGFASVRPPICTMLPRQGVPPALSGWEELAIAYDRMDRLRTQSSEGQWWWELRPHVTYGTLEVRVPDTQITSRDTAAVAAFAHCLVAWLAARHDAGEALPVHPAWLIGENRWVACRDGLDGRIADLEDGVTRPVRDRVEELIGLLRPTASGLGCEGELELAGELAQRNGAIRQRQVARESGVDGLVDWLAGRFAADG